MADKAYKDYFAAPLQCTRGFAVLSRLFVRWAVKTWESTDIIRMDAKRSRAGPRPRYFALV